MDRYSITKVVGKGSFGKAMLCRSRKDGRACIIKQVDTAKLGVKERREAQKEAALLATMRHPNIVGYWESFFDGPGKATLCIVMDYADGGDLYGYLKARKGTPLAEERVLDWFVQITLALKHIHDRKILHRDLKSQNIFLTLGRVVKLGDFGIAKVLANTLEHARTAIGTPYYMSPEICQERRYNHKSDMWSLGCVLYEMATLKHAFVGADMRQLVVKICRSQPAPVPSRYSSGLRALISELLRKEPHDRPSANAVLRKTLVKDRISSFLSQAQLHEEFSHTVLHGKMHNAAVPPSGAAAAVGSVAREVPRPPLAVPPPHIAVAGIKGVAVRAGAQLPLPPSQLHVPPRAPSDAPSVSPVPYAAAVKAKADAVIKARAERDAAAHAAKAKAEKSLAAAAIIDKAEKEMQAKLKADREILALAKLKAEREAAAAAAAKSLADQKLAVEKEAERRQAEKARADAVSRQKAAALLALQSPTNSKASHVSHVSKVSSNADSVISNSAYVIDVQKGRERRYSSPGPSPDRKGKDRDVNINVQGGKVIARKSSSASVPGDSPTKGGAGGIRIGIRRKVAVAQRLERPHWKPEVPRFHRKEDLRGGTPIVADREKVAVVKKPAVPVAQSKQAKRSPTRQVVAPKAQSPTKIKKKPAAVVAAPALKAIKQAPYDSPRSRQAHASPWLLSLEAKMGAVKAVVEELKSPRSPRSNSNVSVNNVSNSNSQKSSNEGGGGTPPSIPHHGHRHGWEPMSPSPLRSPRDSRAGSSSSVCSTESKNENKHVIQEESYGMRENNGRDCMTTDSSSSDSGSSESSTRSSSKIRGSNKKIEKAGPAVVNVSEPNRDDSSGVSAAQSIVDDVQANDHIIDTIEQADIEKDNSPLTPTHEHKGHLHGAETHEGVTVTPMVVPTGNKMELAASESLDTEKGATALDNAPPKPNQRKPDAVSKTKNKPVASEKLKINLKKSSGKTNTTSTASLSKPSTRKYAKVTAKVDHKLQRGKSAAASGRLHEAEHGAKGAGGDRTLERLPSGHLRRSSSGISLVTPEELAARAQRIRAAKDAERNELRAMIAQRRRTRESAVMDDFFIPLSPGKGSGPVEPPAPPSRVQISSTHTEKEEPRNIHTSQEEPQMGVNHEVQESSVSAESQTPNEERTVPQEGSKKDSSCQEPSSAKESFSSSSRNRPLPGESLKDMIARGRRERRAMRGGNGMVRVQSNAAGGALIHEEESVNMIDEVEILVLPPTHAQPTYLPPTNTANSAPGVNTSEQQSTSPIPYIPLQNPKLPDHFHSPIVTRGGPPGHVQPMHQISHQHVYQHAYVKQLNVEAGAHVNRDPEAFSGGTVYPPEMAHPEPVINEEVYSTYTHASADGGGVHVTSNTNVVVTSVNSKCVNVNVQGGGILKGKAPLPGKAAIPLPRTRSEAILDELRFMEPAVVAELRSVMAEGGDSGEESEFEMLVPPAGLLGQVAGNSAYRAGSAAPRARRSSGDSHSSHSGGFSDQSNTSGTADSHIHGGNGIHPPNMQENTVHSGGSGGHIQHNSAENSVHSIHSKHIMSEGDRKYSAESNVSGAGGQGHLWRPMSFKLEESQGEGSEGSARGESLPMAHMSGEYMQMLLNMQEAVDSLAVGTSSSSSSSSTRRSGSGYSDVQSDDSTGWSGHGNVPHDDDECWAEGREFDPNYEPEEEKHEATRSIPSDNTGYQSPPAHYSTAAAEFLSTSPARFTGANISLTTDNSLHMRTGGTGSESFDNTQLSSSQQLSDADDVHHSSGSGGRHTHTVHSTQPLMSTHLRGLDILGGSNDGSSSQSPVPGRGDTGGGMSMMPMTIMGMPIQNDVQAAVGVRRGDSAAHRIEALRVYLEDRLGLGPFMSTYRYLKRMGSAENSIEEDEKMMQDIEELLGGTEQLAHLSVLLQLIAVEERFEDL